ncbi:MAG: right-handed parallel beta-helix repeat-containing protein [Actinomycetota bacterium]|nr:right-handed parallel beta-helix repeat-containing protein [Actinomycetota bacterium]MDQ6946253.1 right-handed parallel beta-helix repeat-containing protein [Actinomycetota bacterium]
MVRLVVASGITGALAAGALGLVSATARAGTNPPSAPPVAMCGSPALRGPTSPPSGAVVVTPGGTGLDILTLSHPAGTTFYLLSGVHTLGKAGSPGIYDQVIPKSGDVYIGAPAAILDGQNVDHAAFTQQAASVRIQYLTIQHFNQRGNEGVVNHDSGDDWIIDHTSIVANHGAAMMAGARQQVTYDCLADNGQYGINGYQLAGGITGMVIDHSEIARNNTDDWEKKQPGCGCSGGLKLWNTRSSRVTNDWIHDNNSAGIWVDGTNVDVTIQSNLIEGNHSEAVIYEISYNGVISGNTLRRNAIGKGRQFAARNDNFPVGAIYISESGGDSRVTPGSPLIDIHDNVFDNNWSGVTVWENADRFCGSGELATMCTLVNPGANTATTCRAPASDGSINVAPYYDDCRWKSQNVKVHNNTFTVDVSVVGLNCSNVYCARQAVFSNFGTYPSWSPYKATVVEQAITFNQGNVWSNNTYNGAWQFMAHDTAQPLTFAAWQAAPYHQDAGSGYNVAAPLTTTTTVFPTTTTISVAAPPSQVCLALQRLVQIPQFLLPRALLMRWLTLFGCTWRPPAGATTVAPIPKPGRQLVAAGRPS